MTTLQDQETDNALFAWMTDPSSSGPLAHTCSLRGTDMDTLLGEILDRSTPIFTDPAGREWSNSMPPTRLDGVRGVRPAEVLVLGRSPSFDASNAGMYYADPAFDRWVQFLRDRDTDNELDLDSWLYMDLCPYPLPPQLDTSGEMKSGPRRDGLAVLSRAINLIRPKYILCMGGDALWAARSLLDSGGAAPGFDDSRGQMIQLGQGVNALASISHVTAFKAPEQDYEHKQDLIRFAQMVTHGNVVTSLVEPKTTVASTVDHLGAAVDRLIEHDRKLFAIDLEWGKDDALRTAQIADSPESVLIVHFSHEHLKPTEIGQRQGEAFDHLRRLFDREGVGLTGHNFRGDIRVLRKAGLDLLPRFLDVGSGSLDTMLAHHLTDELSTQQLEVVAIKLLGCRRYDHPLREWLKEQKISKDKLSEIGYGTIPDEILIPYAAWDAAVTYALADLLRSKLQSHPKMWNLYQTIVHPTNEPLLEMEETGVLIDEPLLRRLSDMYNEKLQDLRHKLQEEVGWTDDEVWKFKPVKGRLRAAVWNAVKKSKPKEFKQADVHARTDRVIDYLIERDPGRGEVCIEGDAVRAEDDFAFEVHKWILDDVLSDWSRTVAACAASAINAEWPCHIQVKDRPGFNPGSADQVKEILFGRFKDNDPSKRRSPEHVRLLNLTPLYATAKNTEWQDVVEKGLESEYQPQADGETLEVLANETGERFLELMRDYRLIEQVCKNFVRPYERDEQTGEIRWESGKGLGGNIESDGRVHTNFRQTLETGRYATSPNLQNIPSRQESKFERIMTNEEGILDPRYAHIREVFTAPSGSLLVEPDWGQAEMWTIAYLAEDEAFIDALNSGDLHTSTAIMVFADVDVGDGRKIGDLSVEEYNSMRGKDPRLYGLRTGAKAVNFGIPYGRSGKAIARQVRMEGLNCTDEQGVEWVEAWHGRFKKASAFLDRCKASVTDPGYLDNPWGRRRHFPFTDARRLVSAMKREATNFPIQSTVGDAMSQAILNFIDYRRGSNLNYRLVLSIHDAVMLEVPIPEIPEVCGEVIPLCMDAAVEVPGCGLHYQTDEPDISTHWGRKLKPEQLLELGVDRSWCGFDDDA